MRIGYPPFAKQKRPKAGGGGVRVPKGKYTKNQRKGMTGQLFVYWHVREHAVAFDLRVRFGNPEYRGVKHSAQVVLLMVIGEVARVHGVGAMHLGVEKPGDGRGCHDVF